MTQEHQQTFWQSLSDEELLRRARSAHLDEAMQQQAIDELQARGLPLPGAQDASSDDIFAGELQIVARQLEFMEAAILGAFLESHGIPVAIDNAEFARINPFLADAIGGAYLRVPTHFAAQADALIAAYEREEHSIPNTFNDDSSSPDAPVEEPEGRSGKTFRLYRKPGRATSIVVKEGFSWWALWSGPLWFLCNAMWFNFALVLALQFGGRLYLSALAARGGESPWQLWISLLAYAAAWILVGKVANGLLASNLEKRGYTLLTRVQARNAAYARERAQNQLAGEAQPASGNMR